MVLLLAAGTLLVFGPVLRHEFVRWDDDLNVYENRYLNPPGLDRVTRFWQAPYARLFVPVTYTVWMLEAVVSDALLPRQASGRLPATLFHAGNLLLHTLSVLVVFALLRLVLRRAGSAPGADTNPHRLLPAAAAGALVFAWHPLQVEPVAWVTGTKDVLAGLFGLVAVRQYLLYAEQRGGSRRGGRGGRAGKRRAPARFTVTAATAHYVAGFVAFGLALLAKPAAVVTPVVAGLLAAFAGADAAEPAAQAGRRQRWGVLLSPLVFWLLVAAPFVLLTKAQQPDTRVLPTPLWVRPFIALDAVGFYLYKLVLPLRLAPDYGRSLRVLLGKPWLYLASIPVAGLGLALFRLRRRGGWRWAALGAAVLVVSVAPVLGLVPFSYQNTSTVADRYAYLGVLGLALAAAGLFARSRGRAVPALMGVVLLLFALRSATQVRHWRNTFTIFEHTLKVNPNSTAAHGNMGIELVESGRLAEGAAHYSEALRIDPLYEEAYNNLGNLREREGRHEEALALFSTALRLNPQSETAYFNMANVESRLGLTERALQHYSRALEINGEDIQVRNNLAAALIGLDRIDEAIAHFSQVAAMQPGSTLARVNFGVALLRRQRLAEAVVQFSVAVGLEPDNVSARCKLGDSLAAQGRTGEALAHYRRALELAPGAAETHYGLGLLLARRGEFAGALQSFSRALEIDPRFEAARRASAAVRRAQAQRDQ